MIDMKSDMLTEPKIAIYIHWPFCKSLCPYCDFNSHIAKHIDHEQWLEAYQRQIEHFANHIRGKYISSIFFGGGTPSLMVPDSVASIIDKLAAISTVDSHTEITLEANPTSYETDKFYNFRDAGINRVSLGVQSLRDSDLALLGREHSAKDARAAIESAAKLFDRYSFDLIYARPDQSEKAWQDELEEALMLCGDHISLYQLTIEKGTVFYGQHKRGNLILPDNDVAANMYEITSDILADSSLYAYEISNYARKGAECRHNLSYWRYDEYLGIGPGAHSRLHKKGTAGLEVEAMMTYHAPATWLANALENSKDGNIIKQRDQAARSSSSTIQQFYTLSREELVEEKLMMGLRLQEGINLKELEEITGKVISEILDMRIIEQYILNGYVAKDGDNLRLRGKGLIVHNYIVPRIIL